MKRLVLLGFLWSTGSAHAFDWQAQEQIQLQRQMLNAQLAANARAAASINQGPSITYYSNGNPQFAGPNQAAHSAFDRALHSFDSGLNWD